MARQTARIRKTTKTGFRRYTITAESDGRAETWAIHRSITGRWYGESMERPGKMIDSPTLKVAKGDLEQGYLVNCSSAGI